MNLPNSMLFQWHITERCNLRCAHCYQEQGTPPQSDYAELQATLREIQGFMKNHGGKALITLTGGEPFVHPEFLQLIEDINKAKIRVAILTNGHFIDSDMAKRLKELNVHYVQVSFEGKRETHEAIRGPGSYDKAIEALQNLKAEGISTMVSFTAHRQNYLEFGEVANMAAQRGVTRVWSDRLIPLGQGQQMQDLVLTPDETHQFIEHMQATKEKHRKSRTEVALHRALQFAGEGSEPYNCKAGWSLLTLLPGGELVPCRRMPIPIGNFLTEGLWELYHGSVKLQELQNRDKLCESCKACFYAELCQGGLKCLAHAMTGDAWSGDPGCWINRRNQKRQGEMEGYGCLRTTGSPDQEWD